MHVPGHALLIGCEYEGTTNFASQVTVCGSLERPSLTEVSPLWSGPLNPESGT